MNLTPLVKKSLSSAGKVCWGSLVCCTIEQPAALANFRTVYRQGHTVGKTGEAAVRLGDSLLEINLDYIAFSL